MHTSLALALAAGVAAMPTGGGYGNPEPISDSEFGLIMDVSQTGTPNYVSLNIAKNTGEEEYRLIGQRLSVYPGTPAYLNNVTPDPDFSSLEFDVAGVAYGVFAADIGDSQGIRTQVTAVKEQKQYEWSIGDSGEVFHKLHAANNQFLACNTTIDGVTYLSLAWGSAGSEGFPEGCFATRVFQNCNVQDSKAKCGSSASA